MYQYKAFISYRHKPLDIKVATRLHQLIEHYVIPASLRKNGEKTVGRVFRDQDELPIAGSLTDNIEQALDASEFLIVICTPDTPQSQWVLREIDYFLQHHDRDHLLAVLVDGTPEESFPDKLVAIRDEEGNVIKEVEPLAANIISDTDQQRMKLLNREKLRILASLIGCRYDDLYQREQRYKTRRMITAGAALLAVMAVFIGVLLNRNAEIKKNYEDALRNQSQYFASESIQLREDGDRLSAIALAIEALPSEKKDRPLVSKAELALSMAIGAYASDSDLSSLVALHQLSHGTDVSDFMLTEDRKTVYTLTVDNIVTAWDAETTIRKWAVDLPTDDYNCAMAGITPDNEIILTYDSTVAVLSEADGSFRWTFDFTTVFSGYLTSVYKVFVIPGSNQLLAHTLAEICLLDIHTGTVIKALKCPDIAEDIKSIYMNKHSDLSEGGKLLASYYSASKGTADVTGVFVLNLESGEYENLFDDFPFEKIYVYDMKFEGNRLFVLYENSTSTLGSFIYSNMIHMEKSELYLRCYDTEKGRLLWESAHAYSFPSYIIETTYSTDMSEKPVLMMSYSNHLDFVDADKGTLLGQAELPNPIVSTYINDEGRAFAFCMDGQEAQYTLSKPDEWSAMNAFDDTVIKVDFRRGDIWVLADGSAVTHWGDEEGDPSLQEFNTVWAEGAEEYYSVDSVKVNDDWIIAFSQYYGIMIGDGRKSGTMRQLLLPSWNDDNEYKIKSTYYYTLEDFPDEEAALTWKCSNNRGVAYVYAPTLQYELFTWDQSERALVTCFHSASGNEWYGICQSSGENGFVVVEIRDHQLQLTGTLEIPAENLSDVNAWYDGKETVYVCLGEAGTWNVNVRQKKVTRCSDKLESLFSSCLLNESKRENVIFSEDGSRIAFIVTPQKLTVYTLKNDSSYDIEKTTTDIISVHFMKDGKHLATLESDAHVRICDINNGTILSSTYLFYSSSRLTGNVVWQETDQDFFLVTVDNIMNMIRYDDWEVFSFIRYGHGFMENQNIFIKSNYTNNGRVFSCFERHTIQQLIDRGKEILNGWELSDQQKQYYAIDE